MRNKEIFKFVTSVLFLCTCLSGGYAQKGTVYLQNYDREMLGSNAQNNALVYTKDHLILVANAKGARQYNGRQWKAIPTKSTLYALLNDKDIVYVGGRSDFGYLQLQSTGVYQYHSLATSSKKLPKTLDNFSFIKETPKHIYFLSEKTLVQVKRKNQIHKI